MNPTETMNLFGLELLNASSEDAVGTLLDEPGPITASFLNAHCVNVAMRDADYAQALLASDFALPDGSGIQLAARMTGRRFRANLNGTDLFVPLCRGAAARERSIFFLGGLPGVAEKAARRAQGLAPGLTVAGVADGFFGPEKEAELIERINASGADILLVAMGVPLQELWIARNRARLHPRLAIGVGAQFDFWSGRIRRAPSRMRRSGVEWAWRLALEPRRMFTRYVIGNPLFVARAASYAAGWHAARVTSHAGAKRALDIVIAGSALALLAPVFLGIAAAIRFESSGPVFFAQTRAGKEGKPFRILKFRSMYRDAEARRAALLSTSDREGVCFKAKRDPRVTRVGRVLRRTSLDELPQLLNVLMGQMSVVGPRPALPEEVAAYPERALGRLAVKPGITGVWQVSGRADIGFDKMIDMDIAYAKSRSILLDIALLALTLRAVVSGRGAY